MNHQKYIHGKEEKVYMIDNEIENRWFLALLLTVILWAVPSIVWGEKGLKDNQHPESIPARVYSFAPDLYLVEDGAKVTASDICLDGSGGRGPISRNIRIDRLNAALIECDGNQQWGVHAGPPQSFIPDGAVHTLTVWPFYAGLGIIALLCLPWGYFLALRDQRKRNKIAAEAQRRALQEARGLLVAQWAKSDHLDIDDPGYISQADFEKRLGELDAKFDSSLPSTDF